MALPAGVTQLGTFKGAPGDRGAKGDIGTFSSVDVVSIAAGEPAYALMTGPQTDRHVTFFVPRGLPGFNAVPTDEGVADLVGASDSATGIALARSEWSVVGFGAKQTNTAAQNKTAFELALTTAGGREIFVPNGVYDIDNLVITGKARIRLADGATLRHKNAGTFGMINLTTGTDLVIRGGSIDGNWQNQTTVTYCVIAAVPQGSRVLLDGTRFMNSANATVRVTGFGGLVSVTNCEFTAQKEHDGSSTGQTNIVQILSGQENAKGLLRFNHNNAIGTTTPAIDGGNPGGVFIATNGYDTTGGGGSGSAGFANGNRSTFEAIGNYFYGYGQHAGPHDISPLHCYPTISGARFIGNIFEACGFSAISAKSVEDFVCQANVIINGLTSTKNTAQEGAILYGPGYQASTFQRPRAVISGNIITNPGGEPTVGQTCISLMGTPDSRATNVLVQGNVLTGTGVGIHSQYSEDLSIFDNVIRMTGAGAVNTTHGVRFAYAFGDVRVRGNDIKARDDGILALQSVNTARFWIEDNLVKVTGASRTAANLRGMSFLKIMGNTFDNQGGGPAVTVQADASANKIGKLVYDRTNTAIAGAVSINSPDILVFEGVGPLSGTPAIVAGGAAGTGPTVSIVGDGDAGIINITVGTAPVAGGLATITFAAQKPVAPRAVILTPAIAVSVGAGVLVPSANTTRAVFILSAPAALVAGSVHRWHYQVL